MPLFVATPTPTSLSAAQPSQSLPSSHTNPNQPPTLSPPNATRKRKRSRVKGKKRVVLTAEEIPQQKKLRNGRVRYLDMSIAQQHQPQSLSRSQAQFAALLRAANQPKRTAHAKQHKQNNANQISIKPGETQQQFMKRVKEDTRKQILAIARRDNKQRIKKRAYYERRQQRILQRKKKRSALMSDSDEEPFTEDQHANTAPGVSLSQLPLYWQHIVRNNGRPVSKKKKRREQHQDVVKFGEQVQRPPKLQSIAIRHGKSKT